MIRFQYKKKKKKSQITTIQSRLNLKLKVNNINLSSGDTPQYWKQVFMVKLRSQSDFE